MGASLLNLRMAGAEREKRNTPIVPGAQSVYNLG